MLPFTVNGLQLTVDKNRKPQTDNREPLQIFLAVDFIKSYKYLEEDVKIFIKNIEIIEYYMNLEQEDKYEILKLLKERRDTNMIAQELMKEGIEKGIKEGIKEGKLKDAKNMLKKGFSVEDILDITKLSKEDLGEAGLIDE